MNQTINIGTHKQVIQYEADHFLCKACGSLGHTANSCNYKNFANQEQHARQRTIQLTTNHQG